MHDEPREIRAVAAMFTILLAYTLAVLATGQVPLEAYAKLVGVYVKIGLMATIIIGVVATVILLVRNRPSKQADPENAMMPVALIKRWFAERRARDGLLSFFWPPLMFVLLMSSFNGFKQLVLGALPFRFDPLFAQWDRALFLGHDPWTVTHALFSAPWMTRAIDAVYHSWFVPMWIGVAACAFLPSTTFRLRTQYLLTYMGVWIVTGSVLAALLPSAGPCFYTDFVGPSESFSQMMANLKSVAAHYGDTKLGYMISQEHLRLAHDGKTLALGGGISAMPSVHNGLAVLFAIAGFRINRRLGWFMSGYAVFIWLASIHLGWHYALDGVVAAVVTFGLWKAAGRLVIKIERGTAAEAKPVLA